MEKTYFVLFSNKLNYPLFLAFEGIVSLRMLKENNTAWNIIKHITNLDYDDFILINKCPYNKYKEALIKIDFMYK